MKGHYISSFHFSALSTPLPSPPPRPLPPFPQAGADTTFELVTAEVWGVGGAAALAAAADAQASARAVDAANLQRARQVDKAQFVDSAFDRETFFGKTFGGGGDGR